MSSREPCDVRWCARWADSRGLCQRHYQAWRSGADVLDGEAVRDSQNGYTPPYCVCSFPDQRPIRLFGAFPLSDVTECVWCHRPPRPA